MAPGASAAVGAEAASGARLGRGSRQAVGAVRWCPNRQAKAVATGHHALGDEVRGAQ